MTNLGCQSDHLCSTALNLHHCHALVTWCAVKNSQKPVIDCIVFKKNSLQELTRPKTASEVSKAKHFTQVCSRNVVQISPWKFRSQDGTKAARLRKQQQPARVGIVTAFNCHHHASVICGEATPVNDLQVLNYIKRVQPARSDRTKEHLKNKVWQSFSN